MAGKRTEIILNDVRALIKKLTDFEVMLLPKSLVYLPCCILFLPIWNTFAV